MVDTFHLDIITPEKVYLSREVEMATLPASDGEIGIMPHHAPLVSTLQQGTICIYVDGHVVERINVTGGFAEMDAANRCVVLAEQAAAA